MGNYDSMLSRLIQYRKQIGMTQAQMGERMGLSQERYSYLENGTTKIGEDSLRKFSKMGCDIDYLVTGTSIENDVTELESMLCEMVDSRERGFTIRILAEIMVNRIVKYDIFNEDKLNSKEVKLLQYLLNSWDGFSMILYIRENAELSQIAMADKLGVGIKKYRKLEREMQYADAELLLRLYHLTGYQPTLFLDICDRRLIIINNVWKKLDDKEKRKLTDFINVLRMIL